MILLVPLLLLLALLFFLLFFRVVGSRRRTRVPLAFFGFLAFNVTDALRQLAHQINQLSDL